MRSDFAPEIWRGLGVDVRPALYAWLEMAVAFALFPTSMQALMAVADANRVMPPKSTWFEPKLRDGLLSHVTCVK